MMLNQFLSLIANLFGAIGSIYVLKSVLRLSPQSIQQLSATKYGFNADQIDSLLSQKSESVVGTCLIVIALLIAIINAAVNPSKIIVQDNNYICVLLAIFISSVVYLFLVLIGNYINSNYRRSTARIIAARTFERLFKKKIIPYFEVKTLYYLNEKYLHLNLPQDKTCVDHIRLIAIDAGCNWPEDIQIECENHS